MRRISYCNYSGSFSDIITQIVFLRFLQIGSVGIRMAELFGGCVILKNDLRFYFV